MQKTITVGVITGKTPYDLSKDFARVMKVDRNRATVLLQTETARVRSMAEIESYKQMEVSKYQIIATLDDRTFDICQSMDMKVFDVKDYEVGVTAPPFHPNCRSTKV
ncbi:minor capsid protein, partial [Sneathia sanguinegens]